MSAAEVQLARVEGGRLLRNPAVWLSVVLTALWAREADPTADPEGLYFLLAGYGLVLPGFVMLAATVWAVLRSRTSGTDGLFDTLPVGPDRRTVGHGLAALSGGVLGLAVILAVYAYRRPGAVLGLTDDTVPTAVEVPRPNLAQLLQGPTAVVALCALGVALARWLPSWLVALALVVPLGMQFLFFGIWSGTVTSVANWLWPLSSGMVVGTWEGCGSDDPACLLPVSGFDRATPWWHLAYLVALACVLVVVAVLRHRRDRAVWAAFGLAMAAVAALVTVQAVAYQPFVPLGGA